MMDGVVIKDAELDFDNRLIHGGGANTTDEIRYSEPARRTLTLPYVAGRPHVVETR